MTADAANFKEYVPLLLFTCPPPFRGVGGERSESEGGDCMGRSAARVPIVQRLWWRLRPWAYLRCEGSEGDGDSFAANFKECDPLHYFTFPPSFRGAQVIEAPPPPALDNSQLSCYHLLKIRSLGLHTVELRFLSIRNISRSALFSVGRLFLRGSRPFVFHGGLYENI